MRHTACAIAMIWAAAFYAAICQSEPALGADWRSRWTGKDQDNIDITLYFVQRARAKVEALRKRCNPKSFLQNAAALRSSLKATYLMPEVEWDRESTLVREVQVDGIPIEVRLLKILPGIYSTVWIYRPLGGNERHPAILYLPGHGDPFADPVAHRRCLGFVKQGYVAMTVEPFGQIELTDTPLRYEYHGAGSTAYLLTTGKSLLGIIMASHTVELSYLLSRSDVNPDQLVIMGGSMGGTHSLWLSAIDTRLKGVAAVSAAPVAEPCWGLRWHCLCDLMVGLYNVADAERIRALIAPRPLMVIYPDLEAPITDEGSLLICEGKLDFMDKAAKSNYFLNDEQIKHSYPFAREVYRWENASDRFEEVVVNGPHGDAKQYRELAYGWFGHTLMGREGDSPIPESPLSPIMDPKKAQRMLNVWPDGHRPEDFLGPTAYTQKETSALIAKLPDPPASLKEARRFCERLKPKLSSLLGVQVLQQEARFSKDGELDVERVTASKYVVAPEPDARAHLLVFHPSHGVTPNGRLYVLLDRHGVPAAAVSADRKKLTDQGSWVVCADLRGMGSLPDLDEAYAGLRDLPLCCGALKLGETVAGWWMNDLLAVVGVARRIVGASVDVTVKGDRETGLVAILAASQSQSIKAVETTGLLASYYSPGGYGRAYSWAEPSAKQGGYASMAPCIPNILKFADIAQLASLVCPRPLTITDPLWASGEAVSDSDLPKVFAWTRRLYEVSGCPHNLVINRKDASGS